MSLACTTQMTQQWRRDVTFYGMDLNPDIVERIDNALNSEALETLDSQIAKHWLFLGSMFEPQLKQMVTHARQAPALNGVETFFTDNQLAALIIQSMGLWEEPAPSGVWGNSPMHRT